jgi:hypothetical protein
MPANNAGYAPNGASSNRILTVYPLTPVELRATLLQHGNAPA